MSRMVGVTWIGRKVADIMQQGLVSISPETPLVVIGCLLWDGQLDGVPVIDDDGTPLGFVSAWDLVHYAAVANGQAMQRDRANDERSAQPFSVRRSSEGSMDPAPEFHGVRGVARDVMTPICAAVSSSTSVVELARALARSRLHYALVIDSGRLSGVVSIFDIVRDLARLEAADGQSTFSQEKSMQTNW